MVGKQVTVEYQKRDRYGRIVGKVLLDGIDACLEQVKAGFARARAQGKTLGRPRVAASIERKVRTHRTKGMGIKAIARKLRIGTGTVQRIVKEAA